MTTMGGCLGVRRRGPEPTPMIPIAFSVPKEITYPVKRTRRVRRKSRPKRGGAVSYALLHVTVQKYLCFNI